MTTRLFGALVGFCLLLCGVPIKAQVVYSEGAQTSPLRKYTAREIVDELRLREAFQSKDKGMTPLDSKVGKFKTLLSANKYEVCAVGELKSLTAASGLRELSSTELIREIKSRVKPKGIYGNSLDGDNRTDLDALQARLQHLVDSGVPTDHPKRRALTSILKNCESVGCMVLAGDFFARPENKLGLATDLYGPLLNLCQSERFYNQPVCPFCTVFLVRKNIVITAGHSLHEQAQCSQPLADSSQFRVLFGFRKLGDGNVRTEFAASEVYSVAEVIAHRCTVEEDWAILRLDRDVTGIEPLSFRQNGQIPNKEDVYVLGHPQGLPLKFADGAFVRENTDPKYFTANLDTYRGNSGSPVFSLNTHQIEGILVRGGRDFEVIFNGDSHCFQSVVVSDEGGEGESVTRSLVFAPQIPD